MTIAMGLIAKNGFVVAADTQETIPGWWKQDQGKIWVSERMVNEGPPGQLSGGAWCLIAGSGASHHLAYISQTLSHRFVAEPHLDKPKDVPAAFATELETFHAKHVLPFAAHPTNDRAVQLIAGFLYSRHESALLVSEDNLFRPAALYAAVGAGSLLATTLLRRWYQLPLLDVWQTILLAAYVIHLVKESVDGCGKNTDIVCVSTDLGRMHISRRDTVELEGVFSDYALSVEPVYLRSLFGAPPPNHAMRLADCRRKLTRIIDTYRGKSPTSSSSDQT